MEPFTETIHIEAEPATVWSMMTDVEAYPAWTASMKRVQRLDAGALAAGSKARLSIWGSPTPSVWTVTALVPGRSFTWEARIMPGVTSSADHELAPEAGGTNVLLRVSFRGPLANIIQRILTNISRRNMRLEAEGLKHASEARNVAQG